MAVPLLPVALAVSSAAAKAALKNIPKAQANKLKRLTDKVRKDETGKKYYDTKSSDDLQDYVENLKDKYGRQVEDLADDFYRAAFKMTPKKATGGKVVNKKIGGSIATKKKKTTAKKKTQPGHNRLY